MKLKVHNSKSSLMILIFLCLNFSESSSQGYYSEIWLLNVENITQTNWNTSDYNLDLKLGFSFDVLYNSDSYVFLQKFDVLQIGYNIEGVDDFLSFNLLKYEYNIVDWVRNKYTSSYKSQSLDLILINRNCISENETNWFKLGLGTGYNFLLNQKNLLLAEGLMKLGYTTLQLNNSVGKLLNSNTPLNFEGIEVELGTRVQYINDSFKLILVSNFKKIFDKRDLNILENGIEIIYSLTEKTSHSDPGYGKKYEDDMPLSDGGILSVDSEILNFTLFGNYNLYSTNNTTTAIPIVGLKLKVYSNLFADRRNF